MSTSLPSPPRPIAACGCEPVASPAASAAPRTGFGAVRPAATGNEIANVVCNSKSVGHIAHADSSLVRSESSRLLSAVARGHRGGDIPTTVRTLGRDPRKHGWQPWRGARLRQDQDGSTGKFLADTRAPSSLWRARCGRTPPKSYATAFGLDSAHAPLLAKTHPMNCTSP